VPIDAKDYCGPSYLLIFIHVQYWGLNSTTQILLRS